MFYSRVVEKNAVQEDYFFLIERHQEIVSIVLNGKILHSLLTQTNEADMSSAHRLKWLIVSLLDASESGSLFSFHFFYFLNICIFDETREIGIICSGCVAVDLLIRVQVERNKIQKKKLNISQ